MKTRTNTMRKLLRDRIFVRFYLAWNVTFVALDLIALVARPSGWGVFFTLLQTAFLVLSLVWLRECNRLIGLQKRIEEISWT